MEINRLLLDNDLVGEYLAKINELVGKGYKILNVNVGSGRYTQAMNLIGKDGFLYRVGLTSEIDAGDKKFARATFVALVFEKLNDIDRPVDSKIIKSYYVVKMNHGNVESVYTDSYEIYAQILTKRIKRSRLESQLHSMSRNGNIINNRFINSKLHEKIKKHTKFGNTKKEDIFIRSIISGNKKIYYVRDIKRDNEFTVNY